MTTRNLNNPVRITIRVDIAKLVMIKAYKRIVNGKVQAVRGYYRKYMGTSKA